jgi:hypothetical protein
MNTCEYCRSAVAGARCDSCGAPVRAKSAKITFWNPELITRRGYGKFRAGEVLTLKGIHDAGFQVFETLEDLKTA